jgi:hypothetical protein
MTACPRVIAGIGTDRPARRPPAALDHPVPGGRARRALNRCRLQHGLRHKPNRQSESSRCQQREPRGSRLGSCGGCCPSRNDNKNLGSQRAVSRASSRSCGCCRNVNRDRNLGRCLNTAGPAPADMPGQCQWDSDNNHRREERALQCRAGTQPSRDDAATVWAAERQGTSGPGRTRRAGCTVTPLCVAGAARLSASVRSALAAASAAAGWQTPPRVPWGMVERRQHARAARGNLQAHRLRKSQRG